LTLTSAIVGTFKTFSLRKEPPVPLLWEVEWAPGLAWTCCQKGIFMPLPEIWVIPVQIIIIHK
jgi:hypothetical protein